MAILIDSSLCTVGSFIGLFGFGQVECGLGLRALFVGLPGALIGRLDLLLADAALVDGVAGEGATECQNSHGDPAPLEVGERRHLSFFSTLSSPTRIARSSARISGNRKSAIR